MDTFIARKLEDKAIYDRMLQKEFDVAPPGVEKPKAEAADDDGTSNVKTVHTGTINVETANPTPAGTSG